MSTAGDATREELLAGRAQFLNAQTGPFQVLVRAEPVDLSSHLRRVRRRAEVLPEPLASVARDYVLLCSVTQELMRHSRYQLTANVYQQPLDELLHLATAQIDHTLGNKNADV